MPLVELVEGAAEVERWVRPVYKAFKEFLNFEGPPDYQTIKAIVSSMEAIKKAGQDSTEM